MPYTTAEKVAGRAFRDAAQAALTVACNIDPPDFDAPHFLAVYRHRCPAREQRSIAIALTEVYQPSPAYDVYATDTTPWLAVQSEQPGTLPPGATVVPAGRFAFLHRAGRCRRCAQTARSRTGRLVDGWQRPSLHRRREIPMSAPQNPGTATDTPQGESIPGPTNPNPNADNHPQRHEQYGGADRQDDEE